MARAVYSVPYKATIRGHAIYTCDEEDKIKHFIDGTSEIEWDLSSIENVEMNIDDVQWIETVADEDEDT